MAIRINGTRALDLETMTAALDMQADAVSDLPAINATLNGFIVGFGSIAQVITAGKWYTLASDGKWYDTNGEEPQQEDQQEEDQQEEEEQQEEQEEEQAEEA